MKFCLLRSGSSGNCTVIRHAETTVLLDAGGLSQIGFKAALAEVNAAPERIDAAIISHLHSDHLNKAALSLFRKHKIPVWVNNQNGEAMQDIVEKYECFGVIVRYFSGEIFTIKSLAFLPFGVSHDARAITSGFKFWNVSAPHAAVTYATDLGCFPNNLIPYFVNSYGIVLEANHDTNLLWKNPNRPVIHKQRVASDAGHLSNAQAAEALVKILGASTLHPRHIVLSHLSKDHNSPEMAMAHIGPELEKCGYTGTLVSALRDKKTVVFEVPD